MRARPASSQPHRSWRSGSADGISCQERSEGGGLGEALWDAFQRCFSMARAHGREGTDRGYRTAPCHEGHRCCRVTAGDSRADFAEARDRPLPISGRPTPCASKSLSANSCKFQTFPLLAIPGMRGAWRSPSAVGFAGPTSKPSRPEGKFPPSARAPHGSISGRRRSE